MSRRGLVGIVSARQVGLGQARSGRRGLAWLGSEGRGRSGKARWAGRDEQLQGKAGVVR